MPLHFKVCAGCAAYFKGDEQDVRDDFSMHRCRPIEGSTMSPMEEASWLTWNLRRRGYVAV